MPKWLRKTLVVLITVFTLGTVSPPPHLLADSNKEDSKKAASDYIQSHQDPITSEEQEEIDLYSNSWEEVAASIDSTEQLQDAFVAHTVYQAHHQTIQKFGTKIEQKRGEEFRSIILPKIEETIAQLSSQIDEETLRNLGITDKPTKGKGEKIFHIMNRESGEDVFRLHVRREHPPGQGFWFSFHYHASSDQFAEHHELGSIYWDQNTPPNWMS
ncbi:YpjP family protein [Alkalihalobacillus sp. AL-G]|uniref:YpjP family protein n=1 Tax=Alkalihalobacillus sp. AL-G TaxID=2926399 RepID=UPI00272C133A|nr:YpjP family protein [Alkalihalobacillus sp. AL-G]WLD91548.1 YpjP family protein [Alkalihalobacillus sp. AL-G]